jgi:signal transduction histidine kinase
LFIHAFILPFGDIYAIIILMSHHFTSAEALKKATHAKAESKSNISHDLCTPLNIIIGFTELLLDEVPGPINANQRQCLNDILSSSKRLLGLINNMLDLPKSEAKDCRDAQQEKP